MKCTRQRCQVAPRTLTMAAFRPSCASEITSFAPRKPRRAKLRRNSTQNGSAPRWPPGLPGPSRAPGGVHANSDDDRDRDDVVVAPCFDVSGIQPDIGPLALNRAAQEGSHPLVDLAAQSRDLALGDALHSHGPHQIVDRAGRDALDIGFLDHGGQRPLGQAARFEEGREVAAVPQLGDAQLDRTRAGLPVAVAVAVALVAPLRAALAVPGAAKQPYSGTPRWPLTGLLHHHQGHDPASLPGMGSFTMPEAGVDSLLVYG